MSRSRLAALLREIRVEAKLTQSQLADALGQSQSYVSKYETGEQRLDLTELDAICAAVEISLVTLVERYVASRS
ncbi:MAG TPA: helix-turn-helix transcriptional regulator [Rhodanobacteraceae bacterium]